MGAGLPSRSSRWKKQLSKPGVARPAVLPHGEKQRVSVAVSVPLDDFLPVAARFALEHNFPRDRLQ